VSSFSGVVGQEAAVAALQGQLARTDGAGATLIVGPEGVGRFLLARKAAEAILKSPALVDAGRHPDLSVLDPDTGIDGVRRAAIALQRRPAMAPRQVLIVRDADLLSLEAHNALLKLLEEPPAGAAVFVVAADSTLLPETVVSRCRLVRAHALSDEETARVLEDLGVPADASQDAEGSPGRACFHREAAVRADAERLLALLEKPRPDALAEAEALARRRPKEESAAHRRRLQEVLRVAAARLRRRLPESESALRSVVDALRSLTANANAAIVLADLALIPWQRKRPES
jgi:DNA polymerase-3 subunit delta'